MAKRSIMAREKKRADTVAKFAVKRAAIKAILNDENASDDEKWEAQVKLQKMPRDASPVRQQNRCQNHWTPAWCLPQIRHVATQAA